MDNNSEIDIAANLGIPPYGSLARWDTAAAGSGGLGVAWRDGGGDWNGELRGRVSRDERTLLGAARRAMGKRLCVRVRPGVMRIKNRLDSLARHRSHWRRGVICILYGTKSEHFGAIAVACRTHAQTNPNAVMRDHPITIEDHQNSRMIADPLHLLDCCLETDGGAAVVITSADALKTLNTNQCISLSGAFGAGEWNIHRVVKNVQSPETESTVVGKALFARAGISHKDIDVCFLYDHFTPLVLMAFEELGFCKRGEGGPFVSDGKLLYGKGSLPFNTSGGNLSEGYIHGMENIVEAVRQLRGQAINQVKDAEIALITSGNGVPNTGMILRG